MIYASQLLFLFLARLAPSALHLSETNTLPSGSMLICICGAQRLSSALLILTASSPVMEMIVKGSFFVFTPPRLETLVTPLPTEANGVWTSVARLQTGAAIRASLQLPAARSSRCPPPHTHYNLSTIIWPRCRLIPI